MVKMSKTDGFSKRRPWDIFLMCFLIGVVFVLVGIGITFCKVVKPLALLDRSREWAETPAQILSVEIEKDGDGSKATYRFAMRYQYEVNGQTHISERVTAFGGSDNVSRYHKKNYARYKPLFNAKNPITCWVDPADPTQAIIDRVPRFDALMFMHLIVFLFPLMGVTFILYSISLICRSPSAPDAYRRPLILSPLYFFVSPVLLYLPYTFFIFSVLIKYTPPWYVWLLLLQPLMLSLIILLYQCIGRIMFRGAYFDMTRPAVVGDTLSGMLHIPTPVTGEFSITLCYRCERRKAFKLSSSVEWETSIPVLAINDGRATTIPVRIVIPPGKPASTHPNAIPLSYIWQLRVKVRHTWLTFEIPVRPAQERV